MLWCKTNLDYSYSPLNCCYNSVLWFNTMWPLWWKSTNSFSINPWSEWGVISLRKTALRFYEALLWLLNPHRSVIFVWFLRVLILHALVSFRKLFVTLLVCIDIAHWTISCCDLKYYGYSCHPSIYYQYGSVAVPTCRTLLHPPYMVRWWGRRPLVQRCWKKGTYSSTRF